VKRPGVHSKHPDAVIAALQALWPGFPEVTLKYLQRLYPLWILSLAFLICACATKPVEMIDKAEKAMQEAKAEHADFFAPDDWKAAEQAYAQASTLLDQQKWTEANTALLRAMSRYNEARSLAKDKKEVFVKAVQNNQTAIDKRYKGLKDKIAAAKLSATQKKTFEEACQQIDATIARIPMQLDQGQFSDADTLARQTLRKIWEVEQDLPAKAGKKSP
jgi:uncharacterized phage infection (PIP) family protein YhgE